jgi:hypothetical protein
LPTTPDVQHWTRLTRAELEPLLREAVQRRFQDSGFWARVRDTMASHQPLAGQVRGLLAQLKATAAGTDDEAFWLPRIVAVRAWLTTEAAATPVPESNAAPLVVNRPPAQGASTGAVRPTSPARTPATSTAHPAKPSVPGVQFQAPASH